MLGANPHWMSNSAPRPRIIQVGSNAGLCISDNDGDDWDILNVSGIANEHFRTIAKNPITGRVYIGATNGVYLISDDRGDTWQARSIGVLSAIRDIIVNPLTGRLHVFHGTGHAYSDDETVWSNKAHSVGFVPSVLRVNPLNGRLVAGGSLGSYEISSSDGLTWARYSTGDSAGIVDMLVHPVSGRVHYITWSPGQYFVSDVSGINFSRKATLRAGFVCMTHDKIADRIIVVGDKVLFVVDAENSISNRNIEYTINDIAINELTKRVHMIASRKYIISDHDYGEFVAKGAVMGSDSVAIAII